jgi:hypothetical protein
VNNTGSIEFQNADKDPEQSDIVRKSFRIPLEKDDDIKVMIAGILYQAADISLSGVSIVCKQTNTLSVSQVYTNCELHYAQDVITGLTSKIIHFTSSIDKAWLNVSQWIDLEKDAEKKISALVKEYKEKLLKSD